MREVSKWMQPHLHATGLELSDVNKGRRFGGRGQVPHGWSVQTHQCEALISQETQDLAPLGWTPLTPEFWGGVLPKKPQD
mmetsp:Transcript_30373/g.45788  ORF Transcript_30373/g.45788 Transcript_30373/m.45788 type:complete len:80 (-) Transcript_30373:489-728(-)